MKSPRWLAVLVLALSSATFALPDNPSMQDGKKDVPGMSSGSPHSAQPPQPSPDALSLPADWRFAHPRADGLIAIRAAALAQSPLLRELLARFPRSFQMNAQKATSTLAQLGALDEAWISIRSGDFLALLQGRLNFPPGFVQLGNGMTSYRISRSAVVVGRAESVADAVERLSRASGVPSPAVRRMKELGAENEICLIGTRALLATPAMTPAMTPAAKDVTGFSLALALRDELRLDLRLDCATLESARRVLANMQKNPALPDSTVKVDAQTRGRHRAAEDRGGRSGAGQGDGQGSLYALRATTDDDGGPRHPSHRQHRDPRPSRRPARDPALGPVGPGDGPHHPPGLDSDRRPPRRSQGDSAVAVSRHGHKKALAGAQNGP